MKLFLLHTKYWGKRLFFLLFILFLLSLVYFFKIPAIYNGEILIKNPFYFHTASLELWLYLLLYFIFIFLFNSIFLTLLTIFYKFQKLKSEKLLKEYEQLFVEKIINYLYSKSFGMQIEDELCITTLKRLRKKNTITILLDVLRRIHLQVIGDMRLTTNKMLSELELDKLVGIYLHSPYLKDKILALKIISDFQIEGYNAYILKLTLRKNYILRTEAFISLIKLSVYDNLAFLKNYKELVSRWDMNNILKVSKEYKKNNIDYLNLIQSDFPRVGALGLLLANKHKRIDLKEIIKQKIGSKDDTLNNEAYLAFLSMADQVSDFEFVMEKFDCENSKNKQAIITSFTKCPDKSLATNFLMNVVENESLLLKTNALKLLMKIDANRVQSYKFSTNPDVLKAHKHVVDFYIN